MLKNYAIYPEQLKQIAQEFRNTPDFSLKIIERILGTDLNNENGMTKALIKLNGIDDFVNLIALHLGMKNIDIKKAVDLYINRYGLEQITLTGSEALTLMFLLAKVNHVFAYPGTSELNICNDLIKAKIKITNGRGDKESAFMAGGACLDSPGNAAAILHGARGLTNATGAIADINRNEIGAIFIVGLPSTFSSIFLPPHGEKNLIKSIGNFVKRSYEITEVVDSFDDSKKALTKARNFVQKIKEAIILTKSLPIGPTLVGIPQDAFEKRWIPFELLPKEYKNLDNINLISRNEIKKVCRLISTKKNPLILIDDFLFKSPDIKKQLVLFAQIVKAPILQIHYLRGPLLFEKLSVKQNPYFIGFYEINNSVHQRLMQKTDLLITLEDRNAYPRVVGELPDCLKIAITSNPDMTVKNGYLTTRDYLLSGNVTNIIKNISQEISIKNKKIKEFKKYCLKLRKLPQSKEKINQKYQFMRDEISEELGKIFKQVKKPVLIDDSQMFGGILIENYDKYPTNLRVFGDHGAFIGGGMAYAAGLALSSYQEYSVFCSLGDQSFVNGLQSLVCVGENKIKVIYIVCNNGKSVSLFKQSLSQDKYAFNNGKNRFLYNVSSLDYATVAKITGLASYQIKFDPDSNNARLKNPKRLWRNFLQKALKNKGPVLIELILPSNEDAWSGIWSIKGNERR